PVRFLDELLADVGGDGNIFAAAQRDYFTADDREYEIGFVAPQLDLAGESDDLAEDACDAIYAAEPQIDRLYRGRARTDPFRGNPVVRTLTAFPQRQEAMARLAAWRSIADGQKREAWPEDAAQQGFQGRAMGDYFDVRRAELAERLGAGDRTVFDQAFEAVQTDIATVMEAAR
ncbi:MAG: hypothetical protein SVU88_01730, partial [Candidatus Nanohaloarchaea archaeon]|nr:hypothetical protein [Candidatus Nanohaloarchaea archaeon]